MGGALGGGGEKFLLLAKFPEFAIADEGIGNLAEGLLDGLLIGKDSFLLLSFGEPHTGANSAGGKDWLSKGAGNTPETCRAGEKSRKRIALEAACTGQGNLRIVGGARDTDLSIGRNEYLFGLANIGAALEKLRGDAGG